MDDPALALDFDLAMSIIHEFETSSHLDALASSGNPFAQAMLVTK